MSTVLEPDAVVSALDVATDMTRYYPTDAAIKKLADEYLPLKIAGQEDTKGFKKVHEARMVVKNLRCTVENTRETLKAPVLKLGKEIDSVAKGIAAKLEPIETHLKNEEDAYEKEKERIKQAAAEAKRIALQKRVTAFAALGIMELPADIAEMPEHEFDRQLSIATDAWKHTQAEIKAAEEKRLAEAAEAKRAAEAQAEADRIERERLAKERADLEAARAKLDKEREEQQAILDAQKKAQEDEAARLTAESKRIADLEAELLPKIEAAKPLPASLPPVPFVSGGRAAGRKIHSSMVEAARLRADSDSKKLLALATLIEAIDVPLLSVEAEQEQGMVHDAIEVCALKIREIAQSISPQEQPSKV